MHVIKMLHLVACFNIVICQSGSRTYCYVVLLFRMLKYHQRSKQRNLIEKKVCVQLTPSVNRIQARQKKNGEKKINWHFWDSNRISVEIVWQDFWIGAIEFHEIGPNGAKSKQRIKKTIRYSLYTIFSVNA